MEVDGSDDVPFQLGDFLGSITANFQGWCNPPTKIPTLLIRFWTPWPGVRQEPLPPQLPHSPVDVPPAKRSETVLAPVTEPTTVPSTQLEPVTAMVETVKDPMSPEANSGVWNWKKNNKISGEMRIMGRQNLGIMGIIISHL